MSYFDSTEGHIAKRQAAETTEPANRIRLNSVGFKNAREAEEEKIKAFFKNNNYVQLIPNQDKFKKDSAYYIIENKGANNFEYMSPNKKICRSNISSDGQRCTLCDPETRFLSTGCYMEKTVDLSKDEIWEKRGFFGKSASTWKQPEGYKNTLEPPDNSTGTLEVEGGQKSRVRRRKRNSTRKSRTHRKRSRKQRKSKN